MKSKDERLDKIREVWDPLWSRCDETVDVPYVIALIFDTALSGDFSGVFDILIECFPLVGRVIDRFLHSKKQKKKEKHKDGSVARQSTAPVREREMNGRREIVLMDTRWEQPALTDHVHNPSRRETRLGRFFDFLLHKNSLYFRKDSTGRCPHCEKMLFVPAAFYHPLLKIAYYLIASGLCYMFLCGLKQYRGSEVELAIICVLLGLVVCLTIIARIITATLFAFGSWHVLTIENELILQRMDEASLHRHQKYFAMFMGVYFTSKGVTSGGDAFCIYLAIIAVACVIQLISYKKTGGAVFGVYALLYAVVVLMYKYTWKLTPAVWAEQVIPYLLIIVLLYTVFDSMGQDAATYK